MVCSTRPHTAMRLPFLSIEFPGLLTNFTLPGETVHKVDTVMATQRNTKPDARA